jgi:hypothetical protein
VASVIYAPERPQRNIAKRNEANIYSPQFFDEGLPRLCHGVPDHGLATSIIGLLESVRIRPNPSESYSLPNPSKSGTHSDDVFNPEP